MLVIILNTKFKREKWLLVLVEKKVFWLVFTAAPQLLKSQSLIPFPRVGRSRADFLQSMASINNEGGGGGSSLINTKPNMAAIWGAYQRQRDGNGQPIKDNTKKVIRWNVKNNVDLREFKRHLIPFPRVGKRQSLIPFPRVGRSQLHFYPLDEDEGVVLSAEDSLTPIYPIGEIVPATSGTI